MTTQEKADAGDKMVFKATIENPYEEAVTTNITVRVKGHDNFEYIPKSASIGAKGYTEVFFTLAEVREEKTVDLTLDIFFEYPMMNEVMRIVKEENPMVIEQDFQMDCRIRLSIRASRMPRLRERYEQLALETGRIRIGKESDTQEEGS